MEQTKTTKLDYAAAFDAASCAGLLAAVMQSFGCAGDSYKGRSGGDPTKTFRQLARIAAVDAGFDPRCVASVCGCNNGAVTGARRQIEQRIAKQERGGGTRRTRNKGDQHPLAPALAKAHAAAAQWRTEKDAAAKEDAF